VKLSAVVFLLAGALCAVGYAFHTEDFSLVFGSLICIVLAYFLAIANSPK
jgi:hypothetical protein